MRKNHTIILVVLTIILVAGTVALFIIPAPLETSVETLPKTKSL